MDSSKILPTLGLVAMLLVLTGCESTSTNAEWDSAERRVDECFNNPGMRGNPYCRPK